MNDDKAVLLEALLVERYGRNHWWHTTPTVAVDDDLTCARRRRDLAADFDALERPKRKAT